MTQAPPSAVTVIDPVTGTTRTARLATEPDGALRLVADGTVSDGETYISPGWADLHTHVFDGTTQLGLHPDRVGLDQGVHVLGDAGSAGQATLRGLLDYVLPAARTTVRVWLNIGSHGLVHLRETADPSFIDVDATLAAVARHADAICGIKIRSSGAIVGAMGLQPLQLARLVADETALPLLVHIGEAPPPIAEALDLLRADDVVTHCFHGKPGRPWRPSGEPIPALQRALDRGVRLDVGHGAASFDAGVARAAVAAGITPHSISTDIHVRNIDGPVHSLAGVMTKLLGCGMTLADVITAVTVTPRRMLGVDAPWLHDDCTIRHATVFQVTTQAPPGRSYVDAAGHRMDCPRHIVPTATIVDGHYRPVASA